MTGVTIFWVLLAGNASAQQVVPPPSSNIRIPIRVNLQPLRAKVEQQVPKKVQQLDRFEMDAKKRYGAKYSIERGPISINGAGAFFAVTTDVEYGVRGCRRTYNIATDEFAMWPCAECGLKEEPRELTLTLHSRLQWAPRWHLTSSTQALPTRFANRCRVTLLDFDLTDRVLAPRIDAEVTSIAKVVDREVPKQTDFRPEAERIWKQLQQPIEVSPRTWLIVQPLSAGFSEVTGSGAFASTTLNVQMTSRIVVGDRPAVVPLPLPNVSRGVNADGFHVPLSVSLSYADASRMTMERLRTIDAAEGELLVRSLAITSGGGDIIRVTADVQLREKKKVKYDGPLVIDGRFSYDKSTMLIRIVDVDYSVRSRNPLVRLFNRMMHDKVRRDLEEKLNWKIAGEVESLRRSAEAALNRQLSPTATLQTRIVNAAVTSVSPDATGFTILVEASGNASINVAGW